MSLVIAIPSYNRPEALFSKTLKTLQDGGVPDSIITVFVASQDEEEKYKKTVNPNIKIIIGKKGITEQRKFIVNYYPQGQRIVSLDDDVEGLFVKTSESKLERIVDLNDFFKSAFEVLKIEGLFIWGIYPVKNPFFMRDSITTDLKFIIGTCYGFINRKAEDILPSSKITEKEDYEQSILYYIKDGGVVRFNDIAVKTKKHSVGGLGITKDRLEANRIATEYLSNTYPEYVSSFYRANGMPEVRLKKVKNLN